MHECCKCFEKFDQQPSFELLPSPRYAHVGNDRNHFVCADCFGQLHAKRGCEPFFKCPDRECSALIIGHHCHKHPVKACRRTPGGLRRMERREKQNKQMIRAPDRQLDPIRCYLAHSNDDPVTNNNADPNDTNSDFNIFLCFKKSSTNKKHSMAIQVPAHLPPEQYSDETKEKLIHFMRLMFHVFADKNPEIQKLNLLSTKDLKLAILSDQSFLFKAVVALGSGMSKDEIVIDESNPSQVGQYGAFWVATEMMRRAMSSTPGILQDLVAKLLDSGSKKVIRSCLSQLKISASRERQRLDNIKKVNEKLLKGWDLTGKKHWVCFITYDNLGYRILGAKAGYDQYVFILVQFISSEQLKELGFYRSRESQEPPVSRKRKKWSDLKAGFTPESILPTMTDYYNLGDQVYALIDYLLQNLDKFPTHEEAEEMLKDKDFECDMRLCISYGTTKRIKLAGKSASLEVEQFEENEDIEGAEYEKDDDVDAPSSRDGVELGQAERVANENPDSAGSCPRTAYNLSGQDLHPDAPIHADLNKTETVRGLVQGALAMRERFLSQESDLEEATDEVPLMEDLGISIGGDGAPCNTFITLERKEPELYGDVRSHAGGFHMLLNCLQKCGARFGDTHLKAFLHPFRATDKKKDWFLTPGDPGQTLQEQPEMVAAHYVVAARQLVLLKGGRAEISATDVHDHMLERAKEHDQCMVVLMWLHMTAIADILRDSERENKPELFRSGAQLALLLYAKCGAPKYMRMGFYYWVKWQEASEADKILHDKFFFTRKTVDGKYVFFDRFQEWFNRDIREFLGKHKKPEQEKLCLRTALLLREWKEIRSGYTPGNDDKKGDLPADLMKNIAISPIFCHQLVLIERLNLWGQGQVQVGNENKESMPTEFRDPTGEEALNPDLLFDITAAESFLKKRFKATYLDTEGSPDEETEKKHPPKQTAVLTRDLEAEKQDAITKHIATNGRTLAKVAYAKFLEDRVSKLKEEYSDELEDVDIPPPKSVKDDYADCLGKIHSVLTRDLDGWKEEQIQMVEESYEGISGFADSKKKKAELEHSFYTFTDKVRSEYKDKRYKVKIGGGSNESSPNAGINYDPDLFADEEVGTGSRNKRGRDAADDTPAKLSKIVRNARFRDDTL